MSLTPLFKGLEVPLPLMFCGSYTWQIKGCTEWYHPLWTSYANGAFHLLATATDVKISLSNLRSCGRAKLAKCASDKATASHTSNNCCMILAAHLSTNFNRWWRTERSGQKYGTQTLNDCKVFNDDDDDDDDDGRAYQGRTFKGAREHFWPDAIPAASNRIEPRFARCKSLCINNWATTTAP